MQHAGREPENTPRPEIQAAIQRMRRWVDQPATTLLSSGVVPGAAGAEQTAAQSGGSGPVRALAPEPEIVVTPMAPPEPAGRQLWLHEMALRLAERISSELPALQENPPSPARSQEKRQMVRNRTQTLLAEKRDVTWQLHGPEEANLLLGLVENEVLGYGPLEPLLADDGISEIMVVGPTMVFVERAGRVRETKVRFQDEAHLMRIVRNILQPLGRTVSRAWPMADGRLPDGSRVNVVVAPSAVNGPMLTIRKFSRKPLLIEELMSLGTLSPQMAALLDACVLARLNIVVSGGTGSGKTTLLNTLSDFIPESERIVTIEDAAELRLNQRHVVTLETKPAESDGTGRVTIRDLVINALRMRPDRIVVGECRGGETLDMLQAMNTGHDGSLTTAHANSPRDCLTRLETMTLMSGMDLPVQVVRRQIASSIHLIIHQARLRDGSRKVTHITEVQGIDGQTIIMQDLFRFVETGINHSTGRVTGMFEPGGFRPRFYSKFTALGIQFPDDFFVPTHRRQGLGWQKPEEQPKE